MRLDSSQTETAATRLRNVESVQTGRRTSRTYVLCAQTVIESVTLDAGTVCHHPHYAVCRTLSSRKAKLKTISSSAMAETARAGRF